MSPYIKCARIWQPDILNKLEFCEVFPRGLSLKIDTIKVENGVCGWGDPSGIPAYTGFKTYGEQVMIDGTIKVPERFESFPPRAEPLEWEENAIAQLRARLE